MKETRKGKKKTFFFKVSKNKKNKKMSKRSRRVLKHSRALETCPHEFFHFFFISLIFCSFFSFSQFFFFCSSGIFLFLFFSLFFRDFLKDPFNETRRVVYKFFFRIKRSIVFLISPKGQDEIFYFSINKKNGWFVKSSLQILFSGLKNPLICRRVFVSRYFFFCLR